MSVLQPQPPFVWPEPRAIEEMSTYEHQPPFAELALRSHSLFGMVSALTAQGVGFPGRRGAPCRPLLGGRLAWRRRHDGPREPRMGTPVRATSAAGRKRIAAAQRARWAK